MTELSKMLQEYREGARGMPTYDELTALLIAPAPLHIFQSPEQNAQLARDAQAIIDGQAYLNAVAETADAMRPAAPQVVADERAAFNQSFLHLCQLNDNTLCMSDVKESADSHWNGEAGALWMYRAALVAAPVQAQEPKPFAGPGAWFAVDVLGNPMREYAPGKWENCVWPSTAPVQPVAVPDAFMLEHAGGEYSNLFFQRANAVRYVKDNDMEVKIVPLFRAAPAAQGDAKEDRAAQRERLNKKVLAMPDGMPDVIGPVLANTRCASCNSFNALHMANCGYCGAAIAAKAAS